MHGVPPVTLRIRVEVTASDGSPVMGQDRIECHLRQAHALLARNDIGLDVTGHGSAGSRPPDQLLCHPRGLFTRSFTWFTEQAAPQRDVITVFYVDALRGARGCSYPGTNWVTVADSGDGRTVVHEIGHLADLWRHRRDPENVMSTRGDGGRSHLTRFQRCVVATSRFASPA
jgi:hypothetical protein